MIKRTTAVYQLLLVSILLLAHAVIPHTHFEDEIVITGSENHQNKEECQHKHHRHSDKDNTGTDFCLLKQVYLARSNNTDTANDKADGLKTQNNHPNTLFAVLQLSENYFFQAPLIPFHTVYIDLLRSFPESGNINSRGSPLA
ncbi:MAG: hypothetical protein JW761_01505 [Prolixibacteraceae bacterium]|nr:hypothetical protein [Prolixibacteraceae bacterium]